jgi:hypothetical protein
MLGIVGERTMAKQETAKVDEERATKPNGTAPTGHFGDESDFTPIRTDYYFWNPAYEVRNPNGTVETRRHPEYAPEGLIVLRGIPLARRMSAPKQESRDGKLVYNPDGTPVYREPRPYYVMVLTAPTLVKTLDGEWKEAKPGEMVWINQRAGQAILEEYLPLFPKDPNSGERDTKAVPYAVFEMIIRPTRLEHYKDRVTGEARKAWKFEQAQLKREPSKPWGVFEPVRKSVSYLPPATPDYDPDELDEVRKLSF